MEKIDLDPHDRRILRLLQRDATLPLAEIADAVGLSKTPCWRRIRRMRAAGVIMVERAIVDRRALGLDFAAYAFVKIEHPASERLAAFERRVAGWEAVLTCEKITGAFDYVLKVVCADIEAYDAFQRDELLALDMVADVQTRIVVSASKDETALPVPDT